MASSRREIYPVTVGLEDLIIDQAASTDLNRQVSVRQVLDIMAEVVGEYEHGSVDVEDVAEGMTLHSYASVVNDLILSIANWEA